jgi:hypothetical protein
VTTPSAPTYPGSNTFPGVVYPGRTPVQTGSGSVSAVGSAVVRFIVVIRGSGTLAVLGKGAVTFSGPGNGAGSVSAVGVGVVTFNGNGTTSTNPFIFAQPEPLNVPPRLLIQVGNIGGTSAQVVRLNVDGSTAPVRAADPVQLSSGGWIGYDYEAPYNQAVTYEVIPSNGAAGAVHSPAVTLEVDRPWLVHPGVPDLSVPVQILLPFGDETAATSAGVHQIMGRATPIVITDGRRKAPTFPMTVFTDSDEAAADMDALLFDTAPLLLQVVQPGVARTLYRWIAVGDVTKSSAEQPFESPWLEWSLPCTTVDRPVGSLQAQRTYADLLAEAASYEDLLSLYETYRGVLTGIGGT